jgi:hypothetical protein
MIKKMLIIGIAAVISFGAIGAAAAEPKARQYELPIKVLYNGRQIASDVRPEMKSGVVFVPFRAVSNALGAKLSVSPDGKTITFTKGDRKVTITIGSKSASVNGEKKTLLQAPYVTKGRTMVPTRFVSEALGEKVEWDAVSHLVWIGNKDVPLLEEVGEKRSFDDFLPMYDDKMHLIDWYDYENDSVYVFTRDQLPIRMVGEFTDTIIYSIWEDMHEGHPVFKVHYKGRHFGIYFLTDKNQPRYRNNMEAWRVENPDGSFVGVFLLKSPWDELGYGYKGWESFDYDKIQYIGFTMGAHNLPLVKYN